jgi:hypothetical protein
MICESCISCVCRMYEINLKNANNEAKFDDVINKIKDVLRSHTFGNSAQRVYFIQNLVAQLVEGDLQAHPFLRSDFIMQIVDQYCDHGFYNPTFIAEWHPHVKNMGTRERERLSTSMKNSSRFSFKNGINTLNKKGQANQLIDACVNFFPINVREYPDLDSNLVLYAMCVQNYVRAMYELNLLDEKLRLFLTNSFITLVWSQCVIPIAAAPNIDGHISVLDAAIEIMKNMKDQKTTSSPGADKANSLSKIVAFLFT